MTLFTRKKDVFDYELIRTCITCGGSFQGKFCNRCGEKVLLPEDKSLKEFLSGVLNAFTVLEGKFIRTLTLLVKHPGKLAFNFSRGVRQPYMRLVSIFFVANFIFFLFPFMTSNTFSTPFKYQSQMTGYGSIARRIIEQKIQKEGVTYETLEGNYNAKSSELAKMLIVLMVVLAAIPLTIINYSPKRYIVEHIYLSFEFNTFLLFINMIALSTILWVFFVVLHQAGIAAPSVNDRFFGIVSSSLSFYFFARALRVFYGYKWWISITKSLLMVLCMPYVLLTYKFLLFYITIQTI